MNLASIITCMYHIIAKIRFQLGKLVQKLASESEKSRFRALGIQNFPGSMSPVPPRWFVASPLDVAPPPKYSALATSLIIALYVMTVHLIVLVTSGILVMVNIKPIRLSEVRKNTGANSSTVALYRAELGTAPFLLPNYGPQCH